MTDLVQLDRHGDVAVITINNPPVNALSPGVPEGLVACIEQIEADPALKAAVMIGAGRTYIAGADIKEFAKIVSGERKRGVGLYPTFQRIEDCAKPVVAAIHGTAFGGGLETAMACHYRVAVPSAQVGQPEVKLGLIPGAGGTQRLPRLAGVAAAVQMCATGDPIRAPEAHALGLVDEVIEGDLLEGAVAFARRIAAEGNAPPKSSERNKKLGDPKTNAAIFAAARATAQKKAKGLFAPLRAIDAVEAAATLPFAEGIKKETELFNECLYSSQSKALIHIFFGERAVAKIPGLAKDTPLRDIKQAAVIGAGTMGGGIAMVYANAGIPVTLKEVDRAALDRGLAIIAKNYARSVKKGKLTQEKMDARMALIHPTLDYADVAQADIVTEAVFEDLDLKKVVFAELDRVCKPEAILASNTSTLDLDAIAASTSRPASVIGHHYFSPANVMRLLEVVRGRESSDEVIATSMKLARPLRKVAVLAGNCHGFIGNRMLEPYIREAQFLLEEGATPQQVDRALTDFGMAMGPIAMLDLAGVDVSWRIRQMSKHLIPEGARTSSVLDKLYELGRYGQKTAKGWYRYEEGSRAPIPDPEVEAIITGCAAEAGIERREITDEEIVHRTLYALINEGARILEEGIALRPVDIDVVYVFGYGFPPYKGGPMFHADAIGASAILDKVTEFAGRDPIWWSPAPLLERLASDSGAFADFKR